VRFTPVRSFVMSIMLCTSRIPLPTLIQVLYLRLRTLTFLCLLRRLENSHADYPFPGRYHCKCSSHELPTFLPSHMSYIVKMHNIFTPHLPDFSPVHVRALRPSGRSRVVLYHPLPPISAADSPVSLQRRLCYIGVSVRRSEYEEVTNNSSKAW
jgi:hypothetical protein